MTRGTGLGSALRPEGPGERSPGFTPERYPQSFQGGRFRPEGAVELSPGFTLGRILPPDRALKGRQKASLAGSAALSGLIVILRLPRVNPGLGSPGPSGRKTGVNPGLRSLAPLGRKTASEPLAPGKVNSHQTLKSRVTPVLKLPPPQLKGTTLKNGGKIDRSTGTKAIQSRKIRVKPGASVPGYSPAPLHAKSGLTNSQSRVV